jgi:lipopolysaccharide assembly outer membrane protein LptD (OstA)
MPGRIFAFFALLLAASLPSPAQEPAAGAVAEKVDFTYYGLAEKRDLGNGETVFLVTPWVRIRRGRLCVYADNLVVWSRTGDPAIGAPDFKLTEFYAEGRLRLENGDQTLEAERAYLNLEDGTILLMRGRLHSKSNRRGVPLTLAAEEFRKLGKGDMIGKDVTISTCNFHVPDYRMFAKEVVIHENWKSGDIEFLGVTFMITPFDFPVFYTPYLPVQFGSQIPLRKLRYENSKNFGHSVYTKFGLDIAKTRTDEDGNVMLDKDGEPDRDQWGFVGVDLDWMKKRGWGVGPEYEYAWEGYRGFGDTYFIHDKAEVPDSEFTDRVQPVPHEDRGRARFFHRQQIWQGLSADAEFHYVSDRNFREEFMEKEFKEDKAPETYLLLRFMEDSFGMTALYRPRINDFQDTVEYLPQVTQSLVAHPVWGGVFLSHHAQYANVRFRKDEDTHGIPQPATNRWDVWETLTLPFSLGPFRFLPFVSGRYTFYDTAPSTDDWVSRHAAAFGARARVAAWKLFPFKSSLLRVDGVRHVASLEARYIGQYTSVPRDELWQYDAVDRVDRFEEVALELRNRFEARNPDTGEVYDVLNVGVAIEFYPDAHRDTRAGVPQNVLYPAHWIGIAPDRDGLYRSRSASNINLDFEASIRNLLTFQGVLDWNPYARHVEETHMELRVKPASELTIKLTEQFVTRLTNTVGVGAEWTLSEKWTLSGEADYDFRDDRLLDHRVGLRRNMHDFDLELKLKYDAGRDEVSASLAIIPHGKKERRLQGP